MYLIDLRVQNLIVQNTHQNHIYLGLNIVQIYLKVELFISRYYYHLFTMTLTLYKLDASPPVRSVLMTIEVLGLSDVEYVDVNLLEGAHLKEEFTKVIYFSSF